MKKLPKIWYSLLKYQIRMCSRATPFGYFAGPSLGRFTESTQLKRKIGHDIHGHTFVQIPMKKDSQTIMFNTNEEATLWFSNPTLFETMGEYRFWHQCSINGNNAPELRTTKKTVALANLLELAREGANWEALLQNLKELEYSGVTAKEYLGQLIENQILVPDTAPSLFHPTPIQLSPLNCGSPIPSLINLYPTFDKALLNMSIKGQLQKALRACAIFSPNRTDTDYRDFSNAFQSLYGNKKIRLVDVMDPEYGFGYPLGHYHRPIDYLDQLGFAKKQQVAKHPPTPTQLWLQYKMEGATLHGLEVQEGDLAQFNYPSFGFGNTFFGLVEWLDIDGEHFCHPLSFGGRSATVLHARHAMGNKEFRDWARSIVRHENNPSNKELDVEVGYFPSGRAGAIALRPLLRDHVLHVNNGPRKDCGINIPMDSLWLHHNGSQLQILHEDTGKIVRPYLTTAFDHRLSSSSLYRFLGDHQFLGSSAYAYFDWGPLKENTTVLPRVVYGNILLSKKTWRFSKHKMEGLIKKAKCKKDFSRAWEEFAQGYRLPKRVVWEDGEQSMVLDTSNLNAIEHFVRGQGNRSTIILKEYLPPATPLVTDVKGKRYATEFLFSFIKTSSL